MLDPVETASRTTLCVVGARLERRVRRPDQRGDLRGVKAAARSASELDSQRGRRRSEDDKGGGALFFAVDLAGLRDLGRRDPALSGGPRRSHSTRSGSGVSHSAGSPARPPSPGRVGIALHAQRASGAARPSLEWTFRWRLACGLCPQSSRNDGGPSASHQN